MRVPVRGFAVLHADDEGPGAQHGSLENLSRSGALVHFACRPEGGALDIELRLADGVGSVSAHTVRAEQLAQRSGWRIAVKFDTVSRAMSDAIEASITQALSAARRRPILVVDDHGERRARLIDRLVGGGMTPLAPKTPLEAIDLLTRAQLQISVCLLAPGFGELAANLASVLADSFPWVTTTPITDDLEDTTERALDAWARSSTARFGTAIG